MLDKNIGTYIARPTNSEMEWVEFDDESTERLADNFLARWNEGDNWREALCFMDEDANIFALGYIPVSNNDEEGGRAVYLFAPDPDFVLVSKDAK